ncbi:MAG: SGNH/GDSL hydrolase family protein [Clostridia bacterium]|nr:SGNH/GDSL hydrolase family protein [Clostridia bacterium]
MELKGKKINFLGDSITLGAGASEPSKCLVGLLKEQCALAEARNYGVGRTRIARQSEMKDPVADEDFLMRAEKMDRDCDIIVVFGGTNDFGHGQAPLGKFEDTEPFTFYGALHSLILYLIENFTDSEIVFLTPMHRHNEVSCYGCWKPEGVEQRPLCDYVKAIKEVCAHHSVPVLDLFSSGSMHGNNPIWCKKYMPDGLHPNDAGYIRLAQRVRSFLEAL